jgi:predicted permease
MSVLISITLKIVVLMAAGFFAAHFKIMNEAVKKGLSEMLIYVFLPANLFVSSQADFSISQMVGIGYTIVFTLVFYAVVIPLCYFGSRPFFKTRTKSGMFALLVAFANTGFIGMSIIRETVSGSGLLYAAVYNCIFDVVYFSLGVMLLQSEKEKFSIYAILKNVIIWIAIAAIILYVIPYRFPVVFTETVDVLGGCMLPASMMIIGAELYTIKPSEVFTAKAAYITSFFRMIMVPGITLMVLALLDMEKPLAMTMVLLTAMPSGSLNVIVGRKYDADVKYAATTIMQNTLIMLLTLPAFIYLCEKFL